jgi:hypothetical protein
MGLDVTEEVVHKSLSELFQHAPTKRVSVDGILKSVATIFEVGVNDLRGTSRVKAFAFPRQVAMYLAKELINESLMRLSSAHQRRAPASSSRHGPPQPRKPLLDPMNAFCTRDPLDNSFFKMNDI